MKFLLIVAIAVFGHFSASSQSTLDSLLEEHFEGEKMDFLQNILQTVRYPRLALENCVMVKITAKISIDDRGNITDIQQSPMMGYGFEESINDALKQTMGKWKKNKPGVVPISFGFAIDDEDIPADVNIKAYKTGDLMGCLTKEMLLKDAIKYIKKKKYKKAQKAIDQLLFRYPDSKHYQGLAAVVEGELQR